jgi:hypothetical protein
MQSFLMGLITLFALASYFMGVLRMLQNRYKPSTFSRVIWLLLAINSYAGVYLSQSSSSSVLLSGIAVLGGIAMCIVSFFKGSREMGRLEVFCIFLLIISLIIWLLFDAPLTNLCISLFAHFVGGLPTYKKVWREPGSEDTSFWAFFFVAGLLSVFVSDLADIKGILYPLYFILFDGSILLLTSRKYLKKVVVELIL